MAEDKNLVTYESFEEFKQKLVQAVLAIQGGAWYASASYTVGNLVYYYDKIYVCKVDSPAGTLPTDTSKWEPLIDYTPVNEEVMMVGDSILTTSNNYGLVVQGE